MSDIDFRLRELERRVGKLEDATAAIPVMQRDIASISKSMEDLRQDVADEFRWMRRTLIGFFVSITLLLCGLAATNIFG